MAARRWLFGLAITAAFGAWLIGCGGDNPTSVGSDTRSVPDSLRSVDLTAVRTDSVFALPGSLGRSTVGQIGQQFPYTSGLLVAFRIPTRTFAANHGSVDTLHVDELNLVFATDSLLVAPFTGTMTIGVQEVAPAARGWAAAAFVDSLLLHVPTLEPEAIAADTLLAGSSLANHPGKFTFKLRPSFLAGWDSVRTRGDSLNVNLVVKFRNFAGPGRGFLEIPLRTRVGTLAGTLNGFSAASNTAIVSAAPVRSRPVVEFDPSYSPGTKLVVSDGYRMHTYLRFASLRTAPLPESALVYRADLILTQVDTLTGTSFGTTPSFGAVIPADTVKIYRDSTALRGLAFKTLLVAVPGAHTTLAVTPYVFDIQEKHVPDLGMILRLSNEGSKVRHFEFYGSAALDPLVRPRLRIVYSLPARFERGKR
jgi:hypothetical protein